MDNAYKKVISDKKGQAKRIMNGDRLKKCNIAIHTSSAAAAAAAAVPIPVADAIPITASQITMVITLGKIFDTAITESIAKSMVSAAASTFVGRSLVKMIPVLGWGISAGVAASVTEAIGWTVAVDFAQKEAKQYTEHNDTENNASDDADEKYDYKSKIDSLTEEAELFVTGRKKRCDNEDEYSNLISEIEKILDSLEDDHRLRELYDKLYEIIE